MLKRSVLVLVSALLPACGAAPASVVDPSSAAPQAEATAAAWPEPENKAPTRWLVLGPFGQGEPRATALDRDFLLTIGGEGAPRIDASTRLTLDDRPIGVKTVEADAAHSVDLEKLYGGDTDFQIAYAYGQMTLEQATRARASFGSDDGAAGWVNGTRIHRLVTPGRALDPDSDHFEVEL
jgi:hypothetical protein